MPLLHWSKSRHLDFEVCPRRFFYNEIAAPRNPTIRSLADRRTPHLVRHEVVRDCIGKIVRKGPKQKQPLMAALASCEKLLTHAIPEPLDANAQYSIAEACLRNLVNAVLPEIWQAKVLYIATGDPVEFVYDGVTMFAVPELVLDKGDQIEILNWKTGSSSFHRDNDLMLRTGGLTCWARSVLKEVVKPVTVIDVFLREGPNPTAYPVHLSDSEVRAFVSRADAVCQAYSISARVADFPAKPDLNTCRFCNFKEICPEYAAITEIDYEIATINAAIHAVKQEHEDALTSVAGEEVAANHGR